MSSDKETKGFIGFVGDGCGLSFRVFRASG
jgi:hypothetical protein